VRDSSGKEGMTSCCKCLFEQLAANLARVQAENVQNVKEKSRGLIPSPFSPLFPISKFHCSPQNDPKTSLVPLKLIITYTPGGGGLS